MSGNDTQEVFALVSSGRYLQALQLAESLVNSPDVSLPAFKACIHALYKALRHDPDTFSAYLQLEAVQFLRSGINRLFGSDYVDFFRRRRSDLGSRRQFVDGLDGGIAAELNQLIITFTRLNCTEALKAARCVRQKDFRRACELYAQAMGKGPLSKYEETSYGWALEQSCRETADDSLKYQHVVSYLKLTQLEKPSELNSRMLRHADSLFEYPELDYPAYLQAFRLETLQRTDFTPPPSAPYPSSPSGSAGSSQGSGTAQSSLYERVLLHAMANAEHRLKARQSVYQPALDAVLERVDGCNQENREHSDVSALSVQMLASEVSLLCTLKRGSEALPHALQLVKLRSSDEKPWQLLSQCYLQVGETHKAVCCLCRTLTLKDKNLNNLSAVQCLKAAVVFKDADDEGHAGELADLAAYLVERSGYSGGLFADFCHEHASWYEPQLQTDISAFDALKRELLDFAAEADDILYPGLKLYHACVGASGEIAKKDGGVRQSRNIYVSLDPADWPVNLICDAALASAFKDGEVVDVRISPDPPDKRCWSRIISVQRGSHSVSDVLIYKTAAVTFVNERLESYHIIFEDRERSFIFMDRVEGDLNIGDCVQLQMARSSKRGRELLLCMDCRPAKKRPSVLFKKADITVTRISHSGLALTEADITIADPWVTDFGLTVGDKVMAEAVLSYNRKRECFTWSAYNVELIDEEPAAGSRYQAPKWQKSRSAATADRELTAHQAHSGRSAEPGFETPKASRASRKGFREASKTAEKPVRKTFTLADRIGQVFSRFRKVKF